MFRTNRFHLCEMFGIPLYVDISFAVLLGIFVLESGMIGVSLAVLLAISVVLHELGHSLTARLFGYETQDITLSLLGGCAALCALPRKAWQEFLTAFAGPAVSFAIAGIILALDRNGLLPGHNGYAVLCWNYLFILNLMLGSFNLLPALPMDGGRIFRSALRTCFTRIRATYIAMCVGRGVAVALVLLPLLGVEQLWIFPIGGRFWLRLLIAWMIWRESYREYQLAMVEDSWRRWDQNDFEAKVSPPPYERD